MSRRPLLALAFTVLLGGCADTSTMFGGRWISRSVLDSGWIAGRPELAVGHYGPEVTGVAYFANAAGVVVGPCPCAFIDHQSVDLDAGTFRATTALPCDDSVWLWELTLETDEAEDRPLLVGTVSKTDGSGDSVDLTLELLDRFIPEDRQACE